MTEEGFLVSTRLVKLTSGVEAQPYLDEEHGVVYKLFDLTVSGSLGYKAEIRRRQGEDGLEVVKIPAVLKDTLEKISVLHEMGAHPTEIVGLAESGDFLIVKQPRARFRPYSAGLKTADHRRHYEDDRHDAVSRMRGVFCACQGLRETMAIASWEDHPWAIVDLHERNIMMNERGEPAVIDALISPVPSLAMEFSAICDAVERAKIWRRTGTLQESPGLDLDSDDDL